MLRRWAVDPTSFGSNEGYSWVDYAATDCPPPHIDFTTSLPTRSWRLWDPYRTAYRDTGVTNQLFTNVANGSNTVEPVFDPKPVAWRGMKGDITLAVDPNVDNWPTACEDDTPFGQVMQSNLAGGAASIHYGGLYVYTYIPVFFAVMKGKYQEVLGPLATGNMGYEIDSGPEDDPAVVSGLDITNPATIESWRLLSWWKELVRIPWMNGEAYTAGTESNPIRWMDHHPIRHIPVNLEANHKIDRNEVLWLVVSSGTTTIPYWPAGGGLDSRTFTGFPLITELHATAMVQVQGE